MPDEISGEIKQAESIDLESEEPRSREVFYSKGSY